MRSVLTATAIAFFLGAASAAAQNGSGDAAALLRNALSAAPPSVANAATVVDHKNNVLRKGTNGWTCMPDDPDIPNNSPMCLDAPWLEFIGALMGKQPPKVARMGIGYMLQGDMPVSNTDPYATRPTAANQWVANSGPHVMLIVPEGRMLNGLPTDPKNGGPWVMWGGTPYAHLMVPVTPPPR